MTTNYTIFNGGKDEVNFETNGVYSDKKITNKEIGAASTYFTYKVDGSSRGKFLYVQTPLLTATQGIGSFEDKQTGNVKYHLDLSLTTKGMDADQVEQIEHFKTNFIENLDSYNIVKGMENSASWLGKAKMSRELVEDKYFPIKRVSKDENGEVIGEYAPTIRFKLWQDKEGKFTTTCYDADKNEVNIEEFLQKGCKVQALYHVQSCWVNKNTGYGQRANLLQLKIWPSDKLQGYSFVDENENENENENKNENENENENESLNEEEDNSENQNDLDNGVNEASGSDTEPTIEVEAEDEAEAETKKKGGRKSKKK